jgi:hypothetical protein
MSPPTPRRIAPPEQTPRRRRPFIVVAVAVLAVAALVLAGVLTGSIPALDGSKTFKSQDGPVKIRLDAPKDANYSETKVEFRPSEQRPDEAYRLLPQALALAKPTDTVVTQGELPKDQVTISMKLPKGLPDNVYER